jgi:hypothetical protein
MKRLFAWTGHVLQMQALKSPSAHPPSEPLIDYFSHTSDHIKNIKRACDASNVAGVRIVLQHMQRELEEMREVYLHQALARGDFDEASKYLTQENLHSVMKYGDTPITLALAEQQWEFLSAARQYATVKVVSPPALYTIVNSQHDEALQQRIVECAGDFYTLKDPT